MFLRSSVISQKAFSELWYIASCRQRHWFLENLYCLVFLCSVDSLLPSERISSRDMIAASGVDPPLIGWEIRRWRTSLWPWEAATATGAKQPTLERPVR